MKKILVTVNESKFEECRSKIQQALGVKVSNSDLVNYVVCRYLTGVVYRSTPLPESSIWNEVFKKEKQGRHKPMADLALISPISKGRGVKK